MGLVQPDQASAAGNADDTPRKPRTGDAHRRLVQPRGHSEGVASCDPGPATDLQRYQHAIALYDRDDYASMMQCATSLRPRWRIRCMARASLRGDELPDAVHKTLFCSLCAPPDGRTFAESAQKAARLAMTIMRENGWQPPSLGGTITHFERMMMDKGNYMLLGTAIAPPGHPWLET